MEATLESYEKWEAIINEVVKGHNLREIGELHQGKLTVATDAQVLISIFMIHRFYIFKFSEDGGVFPIKFLRKVI